MTRYFIEDAKPHQRKDHGPTAIGASAVKYKADNGETGWIYFLCQSDYVMGISEKDVFEQILELEFSDDLKELHNFGGLDLDSSEEELFKLFKENKNNGAANLIHYVYDLYVCGTKEEAELLTLGIGHYSDEIEIPILEEEQLWLDYPEE